MYQIKPKDKKSAILVRLYYCGKRHVIVEEHYRWAVGYSWYNPKDIEGWIHSMRCDSYEDCNDLITTTFDYFGRWTKKQKQEFEKAHSEYSIPMTYSEQGTHLVLLGPYTVKKVK